MIVNLIRHGKTTSNDLKIVCGSNDPHLSESGKNELKKLKENNIYPNTEICLLSTLIRTKETKDIIYPNVDFETTPLLNEINFGEYEETNPTEYKDNKHYMDRLLHNDESIKPNKGESFDDFELRVKKDFPILMDMYYNKGYKNITVIGHGAYFSKLTKLFLDSSKSFKDALFENGKGLIINIDKINTNLTYEIIGQIGIMQKCEI